MKLSRRSLLAGAGSLAVSAALRPRLATAAGGQKVLRLQTRQIEVGGDRRPAVLRRNSRFYPGATEENVKVIFDANNPGLWAFHCHNLFHMVAGMFATVVYDGFS